MTPWSDTGLELWGLNDAYMMSGWQRADRWYDLHPLDHFVHPDTDGKLDLEQLPPCYYVRPATHLEWLAKQVIPVYLNADHAQQAPESATWPHARIFPKAAVEAHFSRYFGSTPAWMLAQAVLEGYREIHIYGIHLATEHEYIEQRPNFEFLIGRVLGPAKASLTVADGLRRYETADGVVVLPVASPLLSHTHQYAFQPRPRQQLDRARWQIQKLTIKRQRVVQALITRPWWQRATPLQRDLRRWEAELSDWQEQLHRTEWDIAEQVVM